MSKSRTYYVMLGRYQRVTVEVDASSRAAAESKAMDKYFDGEIDEFDWETKECEVDFAQPKPKEVRA